MIFQDIRHVENPSSGSLHGCGLGPGSGCFHGSIGGTFCGGVGDGLGVGVGGLVGSGLVGLGGASVSITIPTVRTVALLSLWQIILITP